MSDMTAPLKRSLYAHDPLMDKRKAAEKRFRLYGIAAIALSVSVLIIMLISIVAGGWTAFAQAKLAFPITLDASKLDPKGNRNIDDMKKITTLTYGKVLGQGFADAMKSKGIQIDALSDKELAVLVSKDAAADIRNMVLADPKLLGTTVQADVFASGRIDGYLKGRVTMASAKDDSNISPEQLELADRLRDAGILYSGFNWHFLTNPDASDQRPEAAGIGVGLIGSAYMMLLVLIMCVPIGVSASIYLEEFAPKNRWTDLIEVNISNLAAVPSIVYGVLGLAVFINTAGLPQSSSIVGALVLTLMTLPTIIIATRSAIKAVPPSIRDAALGIGASKMQTVTHHVLPLAMPGILTGTILGLAAALGQTAPLLLIGMVAFVDNYPSLPFEGIMDPATALPVQVYTWTQRSDPAFIERSSGAIIVLLIFLLAMNALAIFLRRKFQTRW
ncbi:MAG: phosphate ABC transporter permease PstA [Deltaproteobacteria bacterium]